ncbi:unnamed protein product [Paramecium primaurelia]|uniref:Ubiquitin fusion degradaton protein n=1 Tax=Paramecium primaurelia TaxID=5886 RepID=A0A8S1LM43_PARPR|nr:unnamed protein product [Paramecium primaurelia]
MHRSYRGYHDNLEVFGASTFSKRNLNQGNKILLPASALEQLIRSKQQGPMIFRLQSTQDNNKYTYVGVLEFTAEEGTCVIPDWMLESMGFFDGCQIIISHEKRLEQGKLIRIQPHETAFIDLPDPRAILENHLRNFICLTEGETISINFHNINYSIDIVKVEPSNILKAVCINEADIEIDFLKPLDFNDAPPNLVKKSSSLVQQEELQAQKQQTVFTGTGVRIDGKPLNTQMRKPSEDVKTVEPYDPRKQKLKNGLKQTQEATQFVGSSIKLGNTGTQNKKNA